MWCENSEFSCPYKLDEVKKVLEEQQDKYLRLSADFDNYRKRAAREKEAAASEAVQKFGMLMFSVADTIKAAVAHGRKDDPFAEGVKIALSSLLGALSKQGF